MRLKIQSYNTYFDGEKWNVEFSKFEDGKTEHGTEELKTADEVLLHYGEIFEVPVRRLDKAV